jgi:hypothetical protein
MKTVIVIIPLKMKPCRLQGIYNFDLLLLKMKPCINSDGKKLSNPLVKS